MSFKGSRNVGLNMFALLNWTLLIECYTAWLEVLRIHQKVTNMTR